MAKDQSPLSALDTLREELRQAREEIERLTAELQKSREILIQLGKLSELGRMTAAIVHEINQPLVGIKSFAQMIRRKLDAADPNLPKIQLIEQQSIQLEGLIGRLRRFSRSALSHVELLDVHGPMSSALALMDFQITKKGIAIERQLSERLPPVHANPAHLQQLFVNLLSNARDAVDGTPSRRIVVASRAAGEDVEVLVGDTGIGVPESIREKIFEPFFTTKDEEHGTGLGLAICREILTLYGGRIDLLPAGSDALHAQGFVTIFSARIPAAQVDAQS